MFLNARKEAFPDIFRMLYRSLLKIVIYVGNVSFFWCVRYVFSVSVCVCVCVCVYLILIRGCREIRQCVYVCVCICKL